MLPPSLQFELKPRRSLPWLRPALVLVVLSVAAALLWWLVPRQRELDRLREKLDQATQALAAAGQPAPAAGPAPAWQADADRDGKLFALTLDARLLEVERCTDPATRVRRFQFDEATGDATLEIDADGKTRLDELVECLTGQADRRWRIASVEVAPDASAAGALRVLIRR